MIAGSSNGKTTDSGSVNVGSTPTPAAKHRLIKNLLNEGLSYSQICKKVGCSKSTVAYHAKQLRLKRKINSVKRYNWQEIQEHYKQGNSVRDCQKRFGFSAGAWSSAVKRGDVKPRPQKTSLKQLLKDGTSIGSTRLKEKLLKVKLLKEVCNECGSGPTWRGKRLVLQLDHINGKSNDNRLENLRILCPNCHSQTETWGAKKKNQ